MEFCKGENISPQQAMELALIVAKRGTGKVSPNPLVGCVVVDRDHCFLSSGFHALCGGDHAEVDALKKLSSDELQESHFYVTLEPCAHEGRTPSCAKTLSQLPIGKLTYGLQDPNPLVSGKGVGILQEAGVEVEEWGACGQQERVELKRDLKNLVEIFLRNVEKQEVFVSLKVATSLDGQMALSGGESRWITNEKSRLFSHILRAQHDAVLVGSGTVIMDNPSLNIRHKSFSDIENKVVILDPNAELLENIGQLKLSQVRALENIYICVAQGNKGRKCSSVNIIEVPMLTDGGFNLGALLILLRERGINSIFVEGGGETLSSFLEQGYCHRLHLFMAPIVMGSGGGLSWTSGVHIKKMGDKLTFAEGKWQSLDGDLYSSFRADFK